MYTFNIKQIKKYMKESFINWYIEQSKIEEGLIIQSVAGKLLNETRQNIHNKIKRGSLKELKYENLSFVSLKQIKEILLKKAYNK